MICLFLMCRLFHFKINPYFADHPFLKHKVQIITPVGPPPSKYNLTSAVPDQIPGEGWLTYKEFFIKSILIGVIYFCLIIIYRASRDFLYWIDNPKRRARKPSTNRKCAEKLIRLLNLLVTPSNGSQNSTTTGVTDTRSTPLRVVCE